MKPTKLLLKEITLKNGVGLNELQRQGLEPFIDRIIKESYNETIDDAWKSAMAVLEHPRYDDDDYDCHVDKDSILKLKKK